MSDELLDTALAAAAAAGELLMGRFRAPVDGLRTKSSPTDPVTEADRASERLIREVISSRRPHDGVLGEELKATDGGSGLVWIVDPLDGTVNYLYGIPHWAVSVAVADATGTLAGVVHDPLRGETFAARRGAGAFLNGRRIRVSGQTELARALVGTGFSYDARARAVQAELLARVLPRVRDIRRAGVAALDLCSVACGRLDAYYEAPTEVWDRAAGELIVREAGGVTSELPAPLGLSTGLVAAGPALHGRLASLLR